MLRRRLVWLLLLSLTTAAFPGCKESNTPEKQPEIAVANSYLLCAVKDICGSRTDVVSLVSPGMCPGHFDISPSQVEQLADCKVLLLFDFQSRIGDALLRIQDRGLKIHSIECPPGLCLPQTYITISRSVADVLAQDDPAEHAEYEKRFALMEKRLNTLTAEIHTEMEKSGLTGAAALTSEHQAVFAKWLGLDVVATFAGTDIETPAGINLSLQQAKDKNIKLVIANQQEGTELAKALAQHLNAKMVVFSNFPAGKDDDAAGFDSLLLENLSGLFRNEK